MHCEMICRTQLHSQLHSGVVGDSDLISQQGEETAHNDKGWGMIAHYVYRVHYCSMGMH